MSQIIIAESMYIKSKTQDTKFFLFPFNLLLLTRQEMEMNRNVITDKINMTINSLASHLITLSLFSIASLQEDTIHRIIVRCQDDKNRRIIRSMGIDIRLQLGKKVKELRIKRGYTQEELAELSDIDYKYIQRIEGKTPPALRIDTIERLAAALKLKPADLLKF